MNYNNKTNAATFSMIVCQLLSNECARQNIPMKDFYERTGIKQPTWSRIVRGQSDLSLEDLRNACIALNISSAHLVDEANRIAATLPEEEKVEIIEPIGTKSNAENIGKLILAFGALAFLIARLSK